MVTKVQCCTLQGPPNKCLFQLSSEAMLWIKEVEMVDSVDDFNLPRAIQGYTHFPNFEMLDARNASALNEIIQNSYFKKRVSLDEQKAQKEDRFLRGGQIAYMIYDYFRVTGAHDTVLDYVDLIYSQLLFALMMFREIDTRCDYRWPRFHLMTSWKVCKNWEFVSASNLCLLEDKVQDRSMYLFTISYGSDAMDQGSGVGWFSGWIEIFVIYSWDFNAELWSTWCEELQHWTRSSIIPISKGKSVWRNESPRNRTFPSK